jgi:P-type Cu+ transporter
MNMRRGKSDLSFLDNKEIADTILDFQEGDRARVSLELPSIHCTSCVFLLENLSKLHGGIGSCQVNFVRKTAAITYTPSVISLKELAELLQVIGYDPHFALDKSESKAKKRSSLPLKIGVAGFCFGNIMLMSFPDYVQGGLENSFARFFGYANLALSIPVLFYSGFDYLRSAWIGVRFRTMNMDIPIAMGMLALFGRSVYEVLTLSGLGFFDSLTGFVFFLLVGKWFQEQTQRKLSYDRDYKSYFPLAATLVESGNQRSIPVNAIEPGNILFIRNQEVIPADCILRKGEALIDYGFVTGESKLVSKASGDKLFAGGRQSKGAIEVEVIKSVDQSYLTQLWNQEAFGKSRSALTTSTEKAAKFFTWTVLAISAATAILWAFIDPSQIAYVVTSVLIVACPCALALAMPFAYGNSMRIFGRHGMFLKNAQVVEHLAEVDTLVFDKTGTLTNSHSSRIEFNGSELDERQLGIIHGACAQSLHPLSKAIADYISMPVIKLDTFEEIPGQGIRTISNGDVLLIGSAEFVGARQSENDLLASEVYVSINRDQLGFFATRKEYRTGLQEMIYKLRDWYKVHLVSGDNDSERSKLAKWFGQEANIEFNQDPFSKLQFIQSLQVKGHKVGMIGDGLNDAGALKQSDVGIAISDDLYSFSPSCDAILEGSKLVHIQEYLLFSKRAVHVVKWSFGLSILYNFVGLFFAVQGLLTPLVAAILMPLSSISVIVFTTIMTNWHAKKLSK